MTGFTDLSAGAALQKLVLDFPFIGLLTAVGLGDGTGFTEVSGGSYSRVQVFAGDWGMPFGSAPVSITNVNPFIFPQATLQPPHFGHGGPVGWGSVIAFGLFDISGNIGAWDYLGGFAWQPCFVTGASPALLMAKGHGLTVNDQLAFSTEYGGTAPAFSSSNFTGLLRVGHASIDTLDVVNNGMPVNTASTGSGMIRKVTPRLVDASFVSRLQFDPGALVLTSA
jgi:hypothetical protein